MKQLFSLLAVIVALSTAAQSNLSSFQLTRQELKKADLPAIPRATTSQRTFTNVSVDYDSFELRYIAQGNPSHVMHYFRWDINKSFDTSAQFALDYAVQTYDTLIDVNNNFAGTPRQGKVARMDSITLLLMHNNGSGLNDTVIFSVFSKNQATVTGTGLSATLNTTPLWSDTIISNVDVFPTPNNFYAVTLYPNVTLPVGQTAGFRVDFKGPVTDTLAVIASYREQCANAAIADTNLIAPRNSSYYLNLGAVSSFWNYTTNLAYNVPSVCRYFYIQNFLFYPSFTMSDPLSLTTTQVNVACKGAATGTATANPVGGGTKTYTYAWSTGATTATASGLAAGTYSVTVMDGTESATASINITEPATGLTVTASSTPSSCGTPDGTATAVVTNNNGTPTYIWNPGGATGATASNLAAGNYRVTATDGACTASASVTVANANAPTVTLTSVNPTCFGLTDGSVTAQVSGGTPNYTYVWSDASTGTAINNLGAGSVDVTITDNANCQAFASATLTEPTQLVVSGIATDVLCNGGSTGGVTLTVSGGTGAYTYAWTGGSNAANLTGATAGAYSVTVSDANSCTNTSSYTISEPSSIAAGVSSTGSNGNDGTATVTPAGGTGTFTYAWNTTPAQTTATATGLAPGTYTVTVTDANGCSITKDVTVADLSVGIIALNPFSAALQLFPNPASGQVMAVIETGKAETISVKLADMNGKIVYSNQLTVNGKYVHEINVSSLPNATYVFEAGNGKYSVKQTLSVLK